MENVEEVQKVVILLGCLYLSWTIIRYVWSFLDVEKDPLAVLVTGAAGMSLIYSLIIYRNLSMIKIFKMVILDQLVTCALCKQSCALLIYSFLQSEKLALTFSDNFWNVAFFLLIFF